MSGEASGEDASTTDGGGPYGGLLKEYNPFKWVIEAFRTGGLGQAEEYVLDALFALVVLVFLYLVVQTAMA